MKTKLMILGQTNYFLYWNNILQPTSGNLQEIKEYINTSINTFNAKLTDFRLASNLCSKYDIKNTLEL
jgi:hypothetical protein